MKPNGLKPVGGILDQKSMDKKWVLRFTHFVLSTQREVGPKGEQ
jgi:hypothetical protein